MTRSLDLSLCSSSGSLSFEEEKPHVLCECRPIWDVGGSCDYVDHHVGDRGRQLWYRAHRHNARYESSTQIRTSRHATSQVIAPQSRRTCRSDKSQDGRRRVEPGLGAVNVAAGSQTRVGLSDSARRFAVRLRAFLVYQQRLQGGAGDAPERAPWPVGIENGHL